MVELHLIYALLYASVAALSAAAAVAVWRRRVARGAGPLMALVVGVAVWSGADALMWYLPGLEQQALWEKVTSLGSWLIPVAFLALAFDVAGLKRWRTRGRIALIAALSFALNNLEWLNPGHLFNVRYVAHTIGSFTSFAPTRGPLYWVFVVYAYALILVAFALIFRTFQRSSGDERTRSGILLLGALAPFVANAATVSGLVSLDLDLAPLAFVVTGALWLWAILRGTLLEVLPVARKALVDQMVDGVLVVDADGRIADANPAARTMLQVSRAAALGQPVAAILGPRVRGVDALLAGSGRRHVVVWIGPKDDPRHIDITVVPFTAQAGGPSAQLLTFHDVTEERRAHEQEARLAAIVTSSGDAMFTVDLNNTVTTWNAAAQSLFGYSAPEMIGSDVAVLAAPGCEDDPRRYTERVCAGERISGLETIRRRKDGSPVEVSLTGSPVLDEVGGITAISVVAHDITARKRIEEELRQDRERLDLALRSAGMGEWHWDIVEDRRQFDEQVCRLLGIDPATFTGTAEEFYAAVHPGDVPKLKTAMARTLERDVRYEPEYRVICPDGSMHWIAARGRLVRDDCGRALKINGILWDVTQRRADEQALRESERRLSLALGAAKLGTSEYEVASDTWRFDDTARGILGLDPITFTGSADEVYAPVHPDDRDSLKATRSGALRTGKPYAVRYRVMHPDGAVHWIYSHGDVVLDDKGKIARMLGVVEDVTEQETSRESLQRTLRELKVLSWCNQTLVRATDEQELLDEVCKVGVEQGGYRHVWVGYAQDDARKSIRPRAFAGHVDGFFESVGFNWGDEDAEHNGVTGLAIRSSKPVAILSIATDPLDRAFATEALARGYASVAAFPLLDSQKRVFGAITFISDAEQDFDSDEMGLLEELASDLAYGISALRAEDLREQFQRDLVVANDRLQGLLKDVVQSMSRVVESRDPYTQGHEDRVARLAKAIARELGLAPEDVDGIEVAALVHDVGKMGVPAEILTKPGALTDIEFQLLKEHSQVGYEILGGIDFPWPVAQMVLQHHERLDGSGYPRGLRGDEITRGARVLAVADVVEAMASHRPYRAALPLEAALAEIRDAGRFDPEVAAACVRLVESGRFSLEQ